MREKAKAPYNGSDLVADGIHQNPVRVESPIKTPNELPSAVREKITLSKESRKAAMSFAKAFGIEIKS